MRSLGERCVEFAYRFEGVSEQPPGSNTGPLIKDWLLACYRRGEDPSASLGLTASNWCSAFVSAPIDRRRSDHVLRPEELQPHGIYCGVVEVVADALASNGEMFVWRPIEDVRSGHWVPKCGDLAIYDRSKPGDPSTSWWRHVNRVVEYKPSRGGVFTTIGGNERDMVRESSQTIHNSKLLGFCQYPEYAGSGSVVEGPVPHLFTEDEKREVLNQVHFSMQRILEDSLWLNKPSAPEDFDIDK